jgi:hypothetical protein
MRDVHLLSKSWIFQAVGSRYQEEAIEAQSRQGRERDLYVSVLERNEETTWLAKPRLR